MLVAGKFIESLIGKYGKHSVYSDGGGGTWYRGIQWTLTKTLSTSTI